MKIKSILCGFVCLCLLSGCSGQPQRWEPEQQITTATTSTITNTTKKLLEPEEEAAIVAVKALKSVLKNPDSLQIHSISYSDDNSRVQSLDSQVVDVLYSGIKSYLDFTYMFEIDYSAQNGFGGMNRDTIYLCYKSNYVSATQLDEDKQRWLKNLGNHYVSFYDTIDIDKLDL